MTGQSTHTESPDYKAEPLLPSSAYEVKADTAVQPCRAFELPHPEDLFADLKNYQGSLQEQDWQDHPESNVEASKPQGDTPSSIFAS